MLGISVTLMFLFKKMTKIDDVTDMMEDEAKLKMKDFNHKKLLKILLGVGKLLVCFLLCLTSIIKASAIGAIYYITFVSILTYWMCNQPLGRIFARILVLIVILIFLNISVIFMYQLQYFHDSTVLETESIFGRLFNLVPFKTYKNCANPKIFKIHDHGTVTYMLPFSLFILYHICVLVSRELLNADDGFIGLFKAFFYRVDQSDIEARWRRVYKQLQAQVEKEKQATTGTYATADKIQAIARTVFQFIASMSHVISNFTMMLWAIVYVDVRGLVFLLWSNLIWLLPFQKKILYFMSPLVIVFIHFMLLSSYLYSIDLKADELRSQFGILDFRESIPKTRYDRWSLLVIQSLFAVIIFISMKQLWLEMALKKQESRYSSIYIDPLKSETAYGIWSYAVMMRIKQSLLNICYMWWIWLVVAAMIRMGFWDTSNILRITFVAFGLIFIIGFQICPFGIFKKSLFVFWWIVIIYALFNLLIIYLYQITDIRNILYYIISKQSFKNVGFKVWKIHKDRFYNLANPLCFQILANIQVTYFQKEFNRITSPLSPTKMSKMLAAESAINNSKWSKFKHIIERCNKIMYSCLQIYLFRIILIIAWFMCLYDLCALYMPAVILLTLACIFRRSFAKIVIYFLSITVSVLIILRLFYMRLMHTEHYNWNYEVAYARNGKEYNITLNTADWVGFHQSQYGPDYADGPQLMWCFIFIGFVTLDRIISLRYKRRVISGMESPITQNVMFPEVTSENCHNSTGNMLKYLFDNIFFKFGCEITFIYMCFATAARMDALSIATMIWLLIMFSLKRIWIKRFWLILLLLFSILIPLQYTITLSWWPKNFYSSMSKYWTSTDFLLRIQQFCYLSNMIHPPKKNKLNWDYMLLQFISSQWLVFLEENKYKKNNPDEADGPNDDVSYKLEDTNVKNPVPDFVTYTRSSLDTYKRIFFSVWYYGSIFMVLFAGVTRPALASFGYLFFASIYLWEGSGLFLRCPKDILRRWNFLMAYNMLVLTGYCVSQIFGCILNYSESQGFTYYCYIYKVFDIGCIDRFEMFDGVKNFSRKGQCVDNKNPNLLWDCFCFFSLMVQQRIFKSYHFFHLVNDSKAAKILEDRGAVLIEENRRKKREEILNEATIIKANIEKKLQKYRVNSTKIEAIRNGETALFDEVYKETDVPLLPEKQTLEEIDDSDFEEHDPMSISMFLQVLDATNIDGVLLERKNRNQKKKKQIQKIEATSSTYRPNMKKSNYSRFERGILFLLAILEAIVVSLTREINKITKTFRHILRDISKDSKIIKEKTNYIPGLRAKSNRVWHPTVTYEDVENEKKKGKFKSEEILPQTIYLKLFKSIWYLIMSHTEWLCYCLIIINQAIGNTFLSLPQALMVFCWGSMSVPLPSKTFWIINIGFCLVTILLQTFFGTKLVPWRHHDKKFIGIKYVLFAPKIIGVWDEDTTCSLLLLFALFFHRDMLHRLGLWKPYTYRPYTIINDGLYTIRANTLASVNPTGKADRNILMVITEGLSLSNYFPKSILHGITKYGEGIRLYMQQSISPSSPQIPVDVYTPMFCCDLLNFFLMIFCFYNFLNLNDYSGIIQILQSNRVPLYFIANFILLTLFMIIDRFIYIRRNRFGKLIYHYVQVLGYHLMFFVVHPIVQGWYIYNSPIVQTFYIVKCIYFLFSGYQIRNGYKVFISYHCLWHHYNIFSRYAYILYRTTPYFIEGRLLLDWIAAESSLGMPAWFKMESITSRMHSNRCRQLREEDYYKQAGIPENRRKKIIMGTLMCSFILLALVFPLMLFSVRGQVGKTTSPRNVKLSLYFNMPDPIFESLADPSEQKRLTSEEYRNLSSNFNSISASKDIFDTFKAEDIVVIKWTGYSFTPWDMSPGSVSEICKLLESSYIFTITFELSYIHIDEKGDETKHNYRDIIEIPPLPNANRGILLNILKNKSEDVLTLPLVFPKFLMISGGGEAQSLQLMESGEHTKESDNINLDIRDANKYRNMLLTLRRSQETEQYWFEIQEECNMEDPNYKFYLKNLVYNDCNYVIIYVFSEKVFSGNIINFLTKGGILGLYLLYFMIVVSVLKMFRSDINEFVYGDLPNSKILMRKCIELHIARDYRNFHLEREIFEELVSIFRSSELLIKVSRYEDSNYNPTFIMPDE
ncbi:piezo-type mechanosensitive ion channel component-like isoform X2 [Anthonomus grandis grandis]|nr:piezo-type mechanosensitive ion channel component-like isoform X2 [Anthonomus grandis grandis]